MTLTALGPLWVDKKKIRCCPSPALEPPHEIVIYPVDDLLRLRSSRNVGVVMREPVKIHGSL
jgi:hypothetical protein